MFMKANKAIHKVKVKKAVQGTPNIGPEISNDTVIGFFKLDPKVMKDDADKIETFLWVMSLIRSCGGPFGFSRVIQLSKQFDFDNIALRALFDRFVNHLSRFNKIECIQTCADEPQYLFTS
jgi:hypothetical protein